MVLAWAYAGHRRTIERFADAGRGGARGLRHGTKTGNCRGVLARVHPRYHTPYVGMPVTAGLSLAVALVRETGSTTWRRS